MPPRQRRRARELSPRELKQEETTHAHKAWDKTLKRITDAFTRAQLVELGLQAGVTGIRGRAKRKDDVARAILRQYFELADPAELEAAARADNVSKIFVLGEAELFVFLARGQYHVRELGRNFDVELNVRRSPDPDTGYQLNASGPKDGIAGLAGWLTDFKQVCSETNSAGQPSL